jgi:hypothetical protein
MADAPEPVERREEQAVTKLQGPVRVMDGRFVLCVPLAAGGDKFIECTQGISKVHEGVLFIVVDRFAGPMGLVDGDVVVIHNADGQFNIRSTKPGVMIGSPPTEPT